MSATVTSPHSSLHIPTTQNTAPVLEYRCLYTSDMRKKQKKWQDGRLKYHTFNRRVMVYDERSNYLGDAFWREDNELQEGSDLQLERGGILVEVSDCIGKKDQDLSELLDKRAKDREVRMAARATSCAATPLALVVPKPLQNHPDPSASLQSHPKPLQSVLGTPRGHYGRALIPVTSPFEHVQQSDLLPRQSTPLSKRRKLNSPCSKNGYAQKLIGASLELLRPEAAPKLNLVPTRNRALRLHQDVESVDFTGETPEHLGFVKNVTLGSSVPHSSTKRLQPPSPPATYAKKLTGTALSLNGGSQARATRRPLTSRTVRRHQNVDDGEFIDIDSTNSDSLEGPLQPSDLALPTAKAHLSLSSNPKKLLLPLSELNKEAVVAENAAVSYSKLREVSVNQQSVRPARNHSSFASGVHHNKSNIQVVSEARPPEVSGDVEQPIHQTSKPRSRKDHDSDPTSHSLRIKSKQRKPTLYLSRSSSMVLANGISIVEPLTRNPSLLSPPPQKALLSSQASERFPDLVKAHEKGSRKRISRSPQTIVYKAATTLLPEDYDLDYRDIDAILSKKNMGHAPRQQVAAAVTNSAKPNEHSNSDTASNLLLDVPNVTSVSEEEAQSSASLPCISLSHMSELEIVADDSTVPQSIDIQGANALVNQPEIIDDEQFSTPFYTGAAEPLEGSTGPQGQPSNITNIPASSVPESNRQGVAYTSVENTGCLQHMDSSFSVQDSAPPQPKLTNPATRGRKAAQKGDQSLILGSFITPEVPFAARRGPLRKQTAVFETKATPHIAGTLTQGDCGPWSREASDLFEWKKSAIKLDVNQS